MNDQPNTKAAPVAGNAIVVQPFPSLSGLGRTEPALSWLQAVDVIDFYKETPCS